MKKWALVLLTIGISIIISACNRDIFSANTEKISANNNHSNEDKVNSQLQTAPVTDYNANKAISNTEVNITKKSFTSSENSTKVQQNTIAENQNSFFGEWQLKRILTTGPVLQNSESDMKSYIGRKLSYSKNSVQDNTNICNKPFYKISQVPKDDFESGNRVSFSKLGLNANAITQVNVVTDQELKNDWDSMGSFFYIKDSNTLIVYLGGYYLEAERIKS
jgi:hypothetical protein